MAGFPHIPDWYAPLVMDPVGGICPGEDTGCGVEERRALDVRYGSDRELIFDGYYGIVGDMLSAHVHVGTATHHLEMRCDDVPDDWYVLVFAMLLEG